MKLATCLAALASVLCVAPAAGTPVQGVAPNSRPLATGPTQPVGAFPGLIIDLDIKTDGTMDINLDLMGFGFGASFAPGEEALFDLSPLALISAKVSSVLPTSQQVIMDLKIQSSMLGVDVQALNYAVPMGGFRAAYAPVLSEQTVDHLPVDAHLTGLLNGGMLKYKVDIDSAGCQSDVQGVLDAGNMKDEFFLPCYGHISVKALTFSRVVPVLRVSASGGPYDGDVKSPLPPGFYYFRYNQP